jgi:hypothetical protein
MTATAASYYLTFATTIAVAVVLVLGLRTLLKGDDPNLSQKLMRWRIGLQAIAIVAIMLFVYLSKGTA